MVTFSTGLSAAEFAKQKQSYLLTLCGVVLREQGGVGTFSCEEWRADGVKEENGIMAVYGRNVGGAVSMGPGSGRLDALLEGDRDTALSAALLWKAGLDFLRDKMLFESISAAPCAAFVGLAERTLFFPPRDLVRIAVESEGGTAWLSGAKRWMHPDKRGADAVDWTFAACLYRVFAGVAPFSVAPPDDAPKPKKAPHTGHRTDHRSDIHTIEDALSGDLREGVLVPAALAAPGLREDIARFIDTHIARNAPGTKLAVMPSCPRIDNDYAKNITPVPPESLAAVAARREEIEQQNRKRIGRKRFLVRNKTLIKGVAAGVVIAGLVIGSFVQAQLERWSTKGLTPAQVVEQYYGAFGNLDHETMSACAGKDAGKADIEMVANLFVIAKMREAYEQKRTVINAQDWDGTAPPPDTTVFGVVDLAVDWPGGGETGDTEGDVTAKARYGLVVPQSFVDGSENGGPVRVSREDALRLQWRKNRWRIAGIERRDNR
ncbi:MAG: hypothetical protein LBG27_03595 [Spirochaetaceae bacterium]|jgi:hypothetical protein|nr:hypothetical protein [Spirochaetaceae bacterium]